MADGKVKTGEPSWRWRRILIYATVIGCFALLYLLIGAQDTRVNDTIAWSAAMIIVLLVMTYTGAATMQDIIAIWTMRSARPYSETSVPVEPLPAVAPDQTVVVQPVVVAPAASPAAPTEPGDGRG